MTLNRIFPGLSAEHKDNVWTLTLDRPDKRNALSAELVESLIKALDEAHQSSARLIVIKGAGKNFSAGFDFTGVEQQTEGDLLLRFVRIETLLQMLISSPAHTICFAHGRNFGAGVDLFAACRQRVSAESASFYMPGLKFGLVLGTHRLAQLVGKEAAQRLLLRPDPFSSSQAHACGLVSQVAEPEAWDDLVLSAEAACTGIDTQTQERLFRVLTADHADASLAALTRSESAPGIKERIARYLARVK
jgi:enoyl-CoA hydratase/carnithine racemase